MRVKKKGHSDAGALLIDGPRKRSLLLHPLVVASLIWVTVSSLYILHLSKILLFTRDEVISTTLVLWLPFVAGALGAGFLRLLAHFFPRVTVREFRQTILSEKTLRRCFYLWAAVSLIETIFSGGLPLLWLFSGNGKTEFDYGIPSIHGIVNSLILALALARYILFITTRQKKHLVIPALTIVWALLTVSRSMILVLLLECIASYICLRGVRLKTAFRFFAGFLISVFLFGIVGDLRQGSNNLFRDLAQPTSNYPDWLPSGVLWAYIYLTTPLNNLMYTMRTTPPSYNFFFPNTVALLFPSVIRKVLYGSSLETALNGDLPVQAFNASTAYIGPYQDFGRLGMLGFSLAISIACQLFWKRKDTRGIAIYSILFACLVLSLFNNLFVSLPILAQAIWFSIFFTRTPNKPPRRIEDAPNPTPVTPLP